MAASSSLSSPETDGPPPPPPAGGQLVALGDAPMGVLSLAICDGCIVVIKPAEIQIACLALFFENAGGEFFFVAFLFFPFLFFDLVFKPWFWWVFWINWKKIINNPFSSHFFFYIPLAEEHGEDVDFGDIFSTSKPKGQRAARDPSAGAEGG